MAAFVFDLSASARTLAPVIIEDAISSLVMNIEQPTEDNFAPAPQAAGEPSLQERFEAMKKRRQGAAQRVKAAEAARRAPARSATFKQALRERFVTQARSYIGTPYSTLRNPAGAGAEGGDGAGRLFLDCCALVRQCAFDLKEELGFEIGHWNQSYQFDTLPTKLAPEALQPGDLIFWTGTYNDPEKKVHKHDLVHVEIFVGTGERGEGTIGSRYEGEGVVRPGVAEFASWKDFGGHGAHGHSLHFRSIEIWLDGVCVNHCKECSWGEHPPGKKSGRQVSGSSANGSAAMICPEADQDKQ